MIKKLIIFGAGSIGNHYANAAKKLGLDVEVFDTSEAALLRMKKQIYPERYGKWDDSIKLLNYKPELFSENDLVLIGTPPEHRIRILEENLRKGAKNFLIEKPFSTPGSIALDLFKKEIAEGVNFFSGYNHTNSKVYDSFIKDIKKSNLGPLKNCHVNWRESWDGILKAHFWMNSIYESYLGYSERGGGAMSEHSHGINLGISIIEEFDEITTLKDVNFEYDSDKKNYDKYFNSKIEAKNSFLIVTQDTISKPTRKEADLNFKNGKAKIIFGSDSDKYFVESPAVKIEENFKKERADDFIYNLKVITKGNSDLITKFNCGSKTQEIIDKAWKFF
ncbi:MAG: hypothetical protein CBE41_04170 [Gammaproteobacteria bacterium TMED281]|nr:MAG: hypothetical protein CBE41_04170 [Gammaproteobacteria bacterium TMED281]|tara:strand:- start:2826 stop:3827 length:1002 start_codon:yes stop_codon:yes gene_type:complete